MRIIAAKATASFREILRLLRITKAPYIRSSTAANKQPFMSFIPQPNFLKFSEGLRRLQRLEKPGNSAHPGWQPAGPLAPRKGPSRQDHPAGTVPGAEFAR